jgi:hypothetical protein
MRGMQPEDKGGPTISFKSVFQRVLFLIFKFLHSLLLPVERTFCGIQDADNDTNMNNIKFNHASMELWGAAPTGERLE